MNVQGKLIMVTGATDGLGKAVAINLAKRGAHILLHGRNPEKGQSVLHALYAASGNEEHRYYNADFSVLKDVKRLSEEVCTNHRGLHILINNAGIGSGSGKRETGADGYELRFTVNYLAAFLLTMKLLPLLKNAAPARIVNIASGSQQPIDFDDVMINDRYNGSRAYAQSKLALIMLTFDLARKLNGSGITVNCLHPASMMDTQLVRESGNVPRTDVAEGAETVEFAATSAEAGSETGVFFDHHDSVQAQEQAYDTAARLRLYQLTSQLLKPFLTE